MRKTQWYSKHFCDGKLGKVGIDIFKSGEKIRNYKKIQDDIVVV